MNEKIFVMDFDSIQPSQLYISSAKLSRVKNNFKFLTTGAITPVPVKKLDGDIIYTDGHTRALAAWLNDQTEVRAFWDEDELDWEAYRICVQWCKDEGIFKIADLKDRIVDAKQYQQLWLKRCQVMQNKLKVKRKMDEINWQN